MTQHRSTSSAAPLLVVHPHDEGHGWHAGRLELLAVVHVAVLLIFTAWDFGGETDFARLAISWWGTLAVPLAGLVCLRRLERRDGMPVALRWLWPLLVFDGLVLLSTLNPSFSYAIIRHNVRTYQSAGVVEVVRGKQNAESALKNLEASQPSADRHEGWRYFIEKTDLKVGTDPTEATHRRQAELENRESKALQETKTPIVPTPDSQR